MSFGRIQNGFLHVVLLLSLLGGFNVDGYMPDLYFREAAMVLLTAVMVVLAISARLSAREWWAILTLPIVVIALPIVFYSLLFSLRYDVPVLPSMLAMRFHVFYLIGPLLYFMYRRGITILAIERTLILAMIIAVIVYLIAYALIDLEAYASSLDPRKVGLIQFDEWRGFRLKGPVFVFLFMLAYSFKRMLSARRLFDKSISALATIGFGYLFTLMLSRIHMISYAAASAAFLLFFAGPRRLKSFYLIAPLLIVIAVLTYTLAEDTIVHAFKVDGSLRIRLTSAGIAWASVLENPLFGVGSASNYSLSYNDLFGKAFFPSDIGALGVLFRFGIVGMTVYYVFAGWLLLRLVRFGHSSGRTRTDPVYWSLTLTIIGMLASTVLTEAFIDADGIPIAAFALGMVFVLRYREGLPQHQQAPNRRAARPRYNGPILRPGRLPVRSP